jgi:hypothetical protein
MAAQTRHHKHAARHRVRRDRDDGVTVHAGVEPDHERPRRPRDADLRGHAGRRDDQDGVEIHGRVGVEGRVREQRQSQ